MICPKCSNNIFINLSSMNTKICNRCGKHISWALKPGQQSVLTKQIGEKEMSKANTTQVAGKHYKQDIQVWDFVHRNGIGYLAGNIIKYVSRYKKKNGLEDLEKAKHYLEKLIEEETKEQVLDNDEELQFQKEISLARSREGV